MDEPRFEGPKVRFRGPFTSEHDDETSIVIAQDGVEVGEFPGNGKVAVMIGNGPITSAADVVAIGDVELDALPDGTPCHVVTFEADAEVALRIFGGDMVPVMVGYARTKEGRRITSSVIASVSLVARTQSADPNCTFWEPASLPAPRILPS